MWQTLEYIAWGLSALLALHMLYDWIKVDSSYDEKLLTSSREGEIEAAAEKHKI